MIIFLVVSIYFGGIKGEREDKKIDVTRNSEFYYIYNGVTGKDIRVEDQIFSFSDVSEAYASTRDRKYFDSIRVIEETLRDEFSGLSFEYWSVTGVGDSMEDTNIETFLYSLDSGGSNCGANDGDISKDRNIEGGKIVICAGGRNNE